MTGLVDSPRLVPHVALPRNRALPLIVAGSILLHALVLMPLLRRDRVDPTPIEVPVELVQLPDKAPEKPTAPLPKTPEKPVAKSQAKAAPQQPKAAQPPPKTAPQPPKVAPKPPPRPAERPVRRAARAPAPRAAPRPPQQPALRFVPPPAEPPRPGMSVAERMKAMLGPMTTTAMPAIALPGASADGSDAVSYSQLVLSQLAKAKKEGRYRGVPGHASVSFSIGDHGEVVRLELVAPSGEPMLDDEVIAMVKRAAPYPPPPPGGQRDYAITLRFAAV